MPAPVSRWFRLLSGCGEQRFHIPEERFGFRNVLAAQRDDFVRSFGKLFSGRSVGRNESQWPFFFELDGVAHQERIPVRSRQQGDQPLRAASAIEVIAGELSLPILSSVKISSWVTILRPR